MVSSLTDRDEAPLAWIHITTAYIFWEIVVTMNAACFDCVRPTIGEADACSQSLKLVLPDHCRCGCGVGPTQAGARVRKWRDHAALLC
jgi:hypothetical protein